MKAMILQMGKTDLCSTTSVFQSCKPFRVTANLCPKVYIRYSDIINTRQLAVSGYDAREKIFQFLYWDSNFS